TSLLRCYRKALPYTQDPPRGSRAPWRSVPVLANTGDGHGSAEQLRLMRDSSGLLDAIRRTLPLPFQCTRATGSHFTTHRKHSRAVESGDNESRSEEHTSEL